MVSSKLNSPDSLDDDFTGQPLYTNIGITFNVGKEHGSVPVYSMLCCIQFGAIFAPRASQRS